MPVKKAQAPHESEYDAQPGMAVALMEKDAVAFDANNSVSFMALGARGGPYVGDPYSGTSPMGTERHMITWDNGGRGKSPRTGLKG